MQMQFGHFYHDAAVSMQHVETAIKHSNKEFPCELLLLIGFCPTFLARQTQSGMHDLFSKANISVVLHFNKFIAVLTYKVKLKSCLKIMS